MPTKAQLKKFEKDWQAAYARIANERQSDHREAGQGGYTQGAYLTQDLLKNRQQLTKNGRQKLVLDYGFDGATKEYTLDDLNKMAAKLKTATKEFHGRQTGVLVADLLKKTRTEDKQAARNVAAATLYKLEGNTLFFQVTASGDTPNAPSHYRVKVRLEEWDYQVNKHKGDNYQKSAIKATHGRVSFDCTCGRHQYWYRYLAGIGGFAVEPPKETVFPKIKNPKLRGACCKHVVKALLALQTLVVQNRIAKFMEAKAKEKGFADDKETFLDQSDIKDMEKAGSFNTLGAFQKFSKAMKAFQKKQKQPATKAAKDKYLKENEAKMKEQLKKADLKVSKLSKMLEDQITFTLTTLKQGGQLNDEAISNFARMTNTDRQLIVNIGKEKGLL